MKPQILIADDSDVMRTLYNRILSDGRYCLTFAESIREASALLSAGTYDFLITDLMFPDGYGTELIKLFRENGSGDKCLLVSATLTPESAAGKAKELAILECLPKPFKTDYLLGLVSAVLSPETGNAGSAE
ncbi:MAG: hypothetical protein AUJ51_09985 [Elusimicrobia bacterium CG1_02_56_21]|nr:MAG: hypothetical protein AUJ51_09985 [Elusimicrobia bacterium CG1_02_56_21]